MKKLLLALNIAFITSCTTSTLMGCIPTNESPGSEQYNSWSQIEWEKIKNLENNLKTNMIGQDYAISKLEMTVKKAYFNFTNNNKPAGTMFFAGPTGVGKSSLVEKFAENIFGTNYKTNNQYINFDMSDYGTADREINFVQKISSFNDDKINILLFDEIEKSNSKIFDKFLQILDKAELNTGKNKTVNFSKSIIIFTSNVGSTEINPKDKTEENIRKLFVDKVIQYFQSKINRPEILARIGINNIIPFNFINKDLIKLVINKQLKIVNKEFTRNWKNLGFKIDNENELIEYLIENVNIQFGTRGVMDLVDSVVTDNLINFIFINVDDIKIKNNQGGWNIICTFVKKTTIYEFKKNNYYLFNNCFNDSLNAEKIRKYS